MTSVVVSAVNLDLECMVRSAHHVGTSARSDHVGQLNTVGPVGGIDFALIIGLIKWD